MSKFNMKLRGEKAFEQIEWVRDKVFLSGLISASIIAK